MEQEPAAWRNAAMACCLSLFGMTVASILEEADNSNITRDLDVVELWSGVGRVAGAGRARGYRVATFDIEDDPSQDLTTLDGFRKALRLVLRLVPGGLLWMGVQCSSWVWLNVKNTKRSLMNLWGDDSYPATRLGNIMIKAAGIYLLVGTARDVHWAVENPPGFLFTLLDIICLRFIRGAWCKYCTDRCAHMPRLVRPH